MNIGKELTYEIIRRGQTRNSPCLVRSVGIRTHRILLATE